MPDKKLTDSEIVKALECYKSVDDNDITTTSFKTILLKEVYLLINRLQAENKNLQEKNSNLTSDLTSLQNDLTSLKAENERLEKGWKADAIRWIITDAKADAYKECIEKVYKFICDTQNWGVLHREFLENGECYWLKQKLDNLLKELVGEDK